MNGFEKHCIDHLSASSINLWTNAPDVWVMSYLLKKRTPMGPAPKRGIAVESAVASCLAGTTHEAAVADALRDFDAQFLVGTEETAKQRDMIAPMVEHAVTELDQFGAPDFPESGQHKITINARARDNSFVIPLWGFLDFVFPKHGLVVDLKTTNRLPSTMSADHQLQRAIYAKAKGNHAVKFLYATPRGARWLEDGDVNEILARAKVQIERLEVFLRHHDTESAVACVPHNPNSFYWRGAEALRTEIYGT